MSTFEVIRQDGNMAPVRKLYLESAIEAHRAFDVAVQQGAIFVEIYNLDGDCQVMVYHAPLTWV